ncbi:unnamed protein product [Linum trigynum]|uniref:F-box domain-containing protein n=1 Tax=Linum trigynum TaxID=586398 RepID=A0AAV2DQP4_9ROSI
MADACEMEKLDLGKATSGADGDKQIAGSQQRELLDELVAEILSRMGTLNEAVRCSSLVCSRWRNTWRSICGGVLDFDEFNEALIRRRHDGAADDEEKNRFANRVDQALSCLVHHQNLDALRIGSDLLEMDRVGRWLEFGLAKRVKQLSLWFYYFFSSHSLGLTFFTPEFLAKHDLRRLESLELYGVSSISQRAVDHILSESNCPSLRCFLLNSCVFQKINGGDAVLRLGSSNVLQRLEFNELANVARVELISAPRLLDCWLRGFSLSQVEFGDGIPQLRDAVLCCRQGLLLQWPSRDQFDKIAPRLRNLSIEVVGSDLLPNPAPPPEWLVFKKLTTLGLFVHVKRAPPSFLECTLLLRAAPVLHKLAIWFGDLDGEGEPRGWEGWDSDAARSSTWKHHSLRVLELHGVHPRCGAVDYVRKSELELAANIIMNSPSLSRVVIDTRRREWLHGFRGLIRFSHTTEALRGEIKMELETQLQGCSATSRIHFTYQ